MDLRPIETTKTFTDINAPEFCTHPSLTYYSSKEFPGHCGAGMLTPYGEQILFVTKYVASTMGQEFEGAKMSIEMLKWAKTFGGRPDSALKTFMENMQHEKIL